jgi:acetolactate synthase-1/2/3 large subunit
MRLGGHAVVEQLLTEGVDLAFCVPGESYLPVLDGLYDAREKLRLITTRHESGASMMAAAYGKLTGRPGICLVTRGPGATNASGGVHVARQDASPMVLLVGQVPTSLRGLRAFQEVDYGAMFGPLAKAVLEAGHPDRLPELIARACRTAVSGEPGPVVVVLPEDVLSAITEAPCVPAAAATTAAVDPTEFVARLTAARQPLLVVGGSGWSPLATVQVREFAESHGIPVATATRHQDLMDNTSFAYVGTLGLNTTPGLAELVSEVDVLVFVGTRPDALTVDDFALKLAPRLLHVHPDPTVLQSVYQAELAIVAGPSAFAAALPRGSAGRSAWLDRLRANYLRDPLPPPGVDPAPYMAELLSRVPADAIFSTGAGAYTAWPQRYRRFTHYPSQLGTQSGTMGYGLPAAITARLVHPDRTAVAFAGDGCFLMTGQELATAVRYGLAPLVIVVNNSTYGTIEQHQTRRFPGREYGNSLVNPDFAAFARSFGAQAEQVRTPAEFAAALDRLLPLEDATRVAEIVTR